MIAAEDVAVLLLAAGLSSRFGPTDKLAEPLHGVPLGLHAARMLSGPRFAAKVVVTRGNGPDFGAHGFSTVVNADPAAGQAGSIRIGVAHALGSRPRAILIALADMPLVPLAHIEALLARFDAQNPIVASTGGVAPGPPALFDASRFDALGTLRGDQGARHLLRTATLVAAPATAMIDIDTIHDLALIDAKSPNRAPDL